MKLLMLVWGCKRDRLNGRIGVNRATWIKEWGDLIDYKIVLGRGNDIPLADELVVDEDDGYMGIIYKQRAAYRWALERGYDHVFIGANDIYRVVPLILASGFEQHDYVGRGCEAGYAGGPGYILSRKAIEAILSVPITADYADRQDGYALAAHGIPLHHDERYWNPPYWDHWFKPAAEFWKAGTFVVNVGRGVGNFDPQWMHECHLSYLEYALCPSG